MSVKRKFLVGIFGAVVVCFAIALPFTKSSLSFRHNIEFLYLQLPDAFFAMQLNREQDEIDGQKLHPKIQYFTEQRDGQDMVARRARMKKRLLAGGKETEVLRTAVDHIWDFRTKETKAMKLVEDQSVVNEQGYEVPLRVYVPDVSNDENKLPVIVYYHGGGFLFGSIEALDGAAKLLANEAESIVVSVDYRLAPQHPYPAATFDAFAAFDWAIENAEKYGGDSSLVGVGGDSAGAYLSVLVSTHQHKTGAQMPTAQLLYYPWLDIDLNAYASYEKYGSGFGLDQTFMEAAIELAVPTEEGKQDPDLRFNQTADFTVLPATIVASAGFDPLRDQAFYFSEKMTKAGGKVEHINYSSLTHGFLESSGTIDDSEKACTETAQKMGQLMRSAQN